MSEEMTSMSLEQLEDRSHASSISARTPALHARSTYKDLRSGGLSDTDIMAFAGEILSLVAAGVRDSAPQED
jgi:hypothetical protein